MATKVLQKHLVRWRVPLGFLLTVISILLATPSQQTILWGAILGFLGVLSRAWAAGHLRKNQNLATGGPYAHTRNPLYFGSFLLGIGFTVAAGRMAVVLIFIGFFLAVYWPVMRIEAEHMMHLFPREYPAYAAAVPLFWPRLRSWQQHTPSRFDWQLYMRYREYRAFLGMVAVLAIFVIKGYWLSSLR